MSNIFEALKRGNDTVSEIQLDTLLEGQTPEAVSREMSPPRPPVGERPAPRVKAHEVSESGPRIERLRVRPSSPLLPFDGTHWQAGEQYRILRTRIAQHPEQPRMLVVTSSCPNDGKSVTVINLAGALALKSDARVALLDADFRRSTICAQLGVPDTPGLADVLKGDCSFNDIVIQAEQVPNLFILPAGTSVTNPAELLDSPGWLALCATCRANFEYIVIDSPPLGPVADYELIQAVCDGVVLVARPDHTDRRLFLKALKTVPAGKLLGVVLNDLNGWLVDRDRHYGAYYQYGAGGKVSKG